jgi:hypothetical protein
LIDHDKIDELMLEVSVVDIANAYLRFMRRSDERLRVDDFVDPDQWAFDLRWSPNWYRDEARLRWSLLALVQCAQGPDDLGSIGAGPLEDFVRDEPSRIEWLVEQAEGSSRFREALSGAWGWDVLHRGRRRG